MTATLAQKLDRETGSMLRSIPIDKKYIPSKKKVTYMELFSDRMLLIQVIRQGVPYSFFNLIQDYTPFSEADWAELLDISTKSLQRYKQSSKQFKSIQSEKIIEMAEVTNVGLDVFGDMSKFKRWLDTPNFSIGGLKPIELLKDSYGKDMVLGELTRINHGILV